MKTLFTLFSKQRSELQAEIDKATSLVQVVKLVQHQVDNLERSYIGELNVTQVRLASFFLDTLRQSVTTLTAANEAKISQEKTQQSTNQSTKFSSKSIILKVLQGLICLGILDSLFSLTRTSPGAWMDILLISLLAGLEVVFQIDKRSEITISPELMETHQPLLQVDSNALLDNLAEALSTIDIAVAQTENVKKTLNPSGIEDQSELLNLLQRLMGASLLEKPQMTFELTKLLPQILSDQGIQAQLYQPDNEQTNHQYFDFEPSIDPNAKEYVTLTPALLKGDHLLRRGRVIEPSNK